MNLYEMPSDLSNEEKREVIKQKLYFEFDDMEKRAEAMEVINKLREISPDVLGGLNSVKIDNERKNEGLELAFETHVDDRSQKILELFHQNGIVLNTSKGEEEKPYEPPLAA